jgi:hypothetical protein
LRGLSETDSSGRRLLCRLLVAIPNVEALDDPSQAEGIVSAMPNNVIQLPTADTDTLILVKPGDDYTAVYVDHAGMHAFKTAKLRVNFRLLEHHDLVLPRWYRVTDYRKGRVSAPIHSDIVREISEALNQRVRHDRIPVASLANIAVHVTVTTVIRDSRPKPLAEVNRYSVISMVGARA